MPHVQSRVYNISRYAIFAFNALWRHIFYAFNGLWHHIIYLRLKSGVRKFTPSLLAK